MSAIECYCFDFKLNRSDQCIVKVTIADKDFISKSVIIKHGIIVI